MGGAGRRSSARPRASITLLVQKGIENYSADFDCKTIITAQRAKAQLLHRTGLLHSTLVFDMLALKETFVTAMCKYEV